MLEQGVYTLAEASKYTGVPVSTLKSWFRARPDKAGKGPIFTSDYEQIGDDFAISFLNLIEAYVASFWKKPGAKRGDIHRANEILQAELKVPHPFAHTDLRTIFGRIIEEKDKRRGKFVDIISKQLFFPQFKKGLTKLTYNPTTYLAKSHWSIPQGRDHQTERRLWQARR